ncbi:unnamed protein product [Amoebophrya sp. A25]|nr:unnamed protein product [Amoebophrya sp. A25]|eukprot:GSA25T00024289001.1
MIELMYFVNCLSMIELLLCFFLNVVEVITEVSVASEMSYFLFQESIEA